MPLNPKQLHQMGILLDRTAADLRGMIRVSGDLQLSGPRLTAYAQRLKHQARLLEQTQRSIDGAWTSRAHLQSRHRSGSHQGALTAVQGKAMRVALLLEKIMFTPARVDFGSAGRGDIAPMGEGPNKLNKRSVTEIAVKLQKLMSQGHHQLSASALSELGSAQARITAASMPGAGGDVWAPFLMTIAVCIEYLRMRGMAKGKITRHHE